jgi:hypothetical protein
LFSGLFFFGAVQGLFLGFFNGLFRLAHGYLSFYVLASARYVFSIGRCKSDDGLF